MSEEMAVSDNTTGEESNVNSDETAAAPITEPEEPAPEVPSEPVAAEVEEPPPPMADSPPPEVDPDEQGEPAEPLPLKTAQEELHDEIEIPLEDIKSEPIDDIKTEVEEPEQPEPCEENGDEEEFEDDKQSIKSEDDKRGIKRRASAAFSDAGDNEFKGFDDIKDENKAEDYNRVLERLEAEVIAARKSFIPLRTVMATPPAPTRASKRPRKDTDGSRPSSALSSRSDGDGSTDASAAYSPAARGGRRPTTEMSSPLLRVPLERGWKRELVFRAALDAHSRRNADIYYYTPQGKKLRSTREVGEHLGGTGLTLENFSFFKEPLGVDDPEKEIIRDAKLMRRVESPVAATTPAPVEGKRTPKPKAPKGASPEPQPPVVKVEAAVKSPPAKIKVKSVGSRLSNSTPAPAPAPAPAAKPPPPAQKKAAPPAPAAAPSTPDNNNSSAWKKPRYRILYNYTDLQQILSLGFD